MGLIKTLKEIFNKNIDCGNDIDDHIVFPLKKKKWLYLNKNIFVKDECSAVIVYKHKVCDVVGAGKFKINEGSIPETYARAKIERLNKKGAKVKRIRAEIYYVNLHEFKNFRYLSDIPFRVKSGSMGKVKGYLEGVCNVKVLDAGALIKALIKDKGKVKLKKIPNKIGLFIGNKINQIIHKNKIPVNQVLSEQEYVERVVNGEMQDALDKLGLFVSKVKLKAVNFPKKFQGKVNEYLTTHKRELRNFDLNSAFNKTSSPEIQNPVTRSVQQSNSSAMQNIQKPLNVSTFKECPLCKKRNSSDSKICINCGNKFN